MKWFDAVRTGIGFGVASGIVTTTGLLFGLSALGASAMVVVGGIMIIAISDTLSDSLGMYISQKSNPCVTFWDVWLATGATFVSKFLIATSFIAPQLIFSRTMALVVSGIWAALLLAGLSLFIARSRGGSFWLMYIEHAAIALLAVTLTYGVQHLLHGWIA
ncbi:MAG: hypothetical protein UU47_C0031G0002 [candidate division TM6 bacterium GW2011_GWE2_41_16]|nr:MAG: hypothetical protein UU47_C0031G0002 [candidate division TM6 bacterium GW2011_GWE2_41_16]